MAWKHSSKLTTANDIAKQIDEAMSILNSCKIAAVDNGFIHENTIDSALDLAWSQAYDARKFFQQFVL
jgi:hypothetical protein